MYSIDNEVDGLKIYVLQAYFQYKTYFERSPNFSRRAELSLTTETVLYVIERWMKWLQWDFIGSEYTTRTAE